MKKVRIGVFGGYRGHTMIDVLYKHDKAELVAVCDKYRPILDKIQKECEERGLNVALYENFDEFIEHDMDAVILANYANEHGIYAVRCMKKGLHVLSEVLPCETMAQAVELAETVEQTGKIYCYAENYCYMRHTFEMWRRYQNGDIGDVTYIEGEYVHDCTSCQPQITYGERDHWRNQEFVTFYCTHSIGPMLTITGQRPVQVTGYETPIHYNYMDTGVTRGNAVEIVKLENGAVARSIHGHFRREPGISTYMIYGQKGMMEGDRFPDDETHKLLHVYREGDTYCKGDWEHYNPEPFVEAEKSKEFDTHGGSDFYATDLFIEKILGNEELGKWCIDVYKALDMGICGILAYRSALNGNIPIAVPNFRNPEEREPYRHDNACCNPNIAGDQLWPRCTHPHERVPDETYDYIKELWKAEKPLEHPREK